MECLNRLEPRIESLVARIKEIEALNNDQAEKSADLSQEITRLRAENQRLKSEMDTLVDDYSAKESQVKNRLESLLTEVEKIDLDVKELKA
jgi:septation ring formation regulator EzrA